MAAGEGLQERADADRDDAPLDARIVGEPSEGAAQDVEVPGVDRHPVHPEGVDDDPHDREEAESGPLGGAGERLAERHAEGEPGDQNGRQKADQARQMGLQSHNTEQYQDGDERQGRDEGGQAERTGHGFQLLDVHGSLPGFRDAEAASHCTGTRNDRVRAEAASTGVRRRAERCERKEPRRERGRGDRP